MATRPRTTPLTKPARRTRKAAPVERTQPSVAQRAYELFMARGGLHGHDLEDWLTAERELTSPPPGSVPS